MIRSTYLVRKSTSGRGFDVVKMTYAKGTWDFSSVSVPSVTRRTADEAARALRGAAGSRQKGRAA